MTDNVTRIGGSTTLDLDPDEMLKKNVGIWDSVVLMGRDKDGEITFASSIANVGDMLWLAEKFKQRLMEEE